MDITKYTKPARKLLPLRRCGAVIVAAGSASRMGGIDKVMAPLRGEPMIVHTVRAFQTCDAISEIVIVTRGVLILPIQAHRCLRQGHRRGPGRQQPPGVRLPGHERPE